MMVLMKRAIVVAGVLAASGGALAVAACIGDPPEVASKDDSAAAADSAVPSVDGGDIDAAGLTDGGALPAPRPIAPLSTAITTTRKPTFKWALPVGIDGAYV